MDKNHIYKAAVYVRLSKEDGDLSDVVKKESNSISNQRDLILNFLKDKKDIEVVSERVDDGYSGVNFERPAFQLMLDDIRSGKVDCVVVKDLLRFGRNYIESGRYLEKIFPMLGVRFIAVNDNYDSLEGRTQTDEIIIPFKNLINDAYCRDISVKIRSHLDIKRKNGEFIGAFAVYGYRKDPMNRNRLLVDEYAAGIVQNIFRWKISGMSQQGIADRLNENGVLSPAEYKKSQGSRYRTVFQASEHSLWSAVAVTRILTNEIYTGVLIQGRHTTPNYKVKKTIIKAEKDWIRIPDALEAVISMEDFQRVREILGADVRVAPDREKVYLFSGIVFCGDCGRQMSRKASTVSGRRYVYYMCSANKKEGSCSSHRIREDELELAVLECLNSYISKVAELKAVLDYIGSMPVQEIGLKHLRERIAGLEAEEEKYEKLKASAYADFQEGLISREDYAALKDEFEYRRKGAAAAVSEMRLEIERQMSKNKMQSEWMEHFLKNRGMEKLERQIVVGLIEKISVYEGRRIEIR